MNDEKKVRRHPNRIEKQALLAAEIAIFTKQYGRKAQRGCEPNDRTCDRELERKLRQFDPVKLDHFLRDDED